ncbi:MAG: serine/threonine protein kinase [Planctomycetota bacterium]
MTFDQDNDPLIGIKIGSFRVEKRLAAGGMGVVYRARHISQDQEVAIKLLAPTLAQDQEYVTRFFREAGAAGQIDHPNVVRVIDVGRHEDKYYLVMEYVEGETLDRILERERRLSLERATRLVRDVAAGLAAAHRAGIIHRDVKPGNIIVSRDGKPHLTDFGLARHTETRKGLTIEGTFLGTPEYASPEQVEGRRLDHRTDLYSLGVTYFQLLSGTLPFLGESPMEIAIKRTKEEPRPLEHAFPAADPRACAIVRKLLQMEPSQRYASATDLIRDLDAILFGQKPEVVQKPATTRAAKNPSITVATQRRLRALTHWGLLGLGLLLAFLSGGLAARGGTFLETWPVRDADLGMRIVLLVGALLAAGGAVFIYRREFASTGRMLSLASLAVLMLLGSLAAGTMIDRDSGQSAVATLGRTLAALGSSIGAPANRLAFGLLFLFTSGVISFEHLPGSTRVVLSRLLAVAGYLLVYSFGTPAGLEAPFRQLLVQAELSIPLATATGLACLFGTWLLTGWNFEGGWKVFGAALSLAGAAGLFAFGALVSQPLRSEGWPALLGERFADFGRSFAKQGTTLAVVLAVGVIEQSVVGAGMRRLDRFYRRKF